MSETNFKVEQSFIKKARSKDCAENELIYIDFVQNRQLLLEKLFEKFPNMFLNLFADGKLSAQLINAERAVFEDNFDDIGIFILIGVFKVVLEGAGDHIYALLVVPDLIQGEVLFQVENVFGL